MKKLIIYLLFLFPVLTIAQQEDENENTQATEIVAVDGSNIEFIDYLTVKNPMKASLYSAILPGAGQIYNGKWWKAPIVWGLLGTGIGFVIYYNNQYHEFRGYYLKKLYGYDLGTPALNNMSKEQLANIQDDRKRTREYAIALTALGYLLNIVDATVDAHLFGIKKDPDLSFQPIILQNQQTFEPVMGFGFVYKF